MEGATTSSSSPLPCALVSSTVLEHLSKTVSPRLVKVHRRHSVRKHPSTRQEREGGAS